MTNSSQGENPTSIVLRDEEGQRFSFVPVPGRFFFEGRDPLFLRRADAPASAEVLPGGRLEAVRDGPFLGRLKAHLATGAR